jgi:hypothetical protein
VLLSSSLCGSLLSSFFIVTVGRTTLVNNLILSSPTGCFGRRLPAVIKFFSIFSYGQSFGLSHCSISLITSKSVETTFKCRRKITIYEVQVNYIHLDIRVNPFTQEGFVIFGPLSGRRWRKLNYCYSRPPIKAGYDTRFNTGSFFDGDEWTALVPLYNSTISSYENKPFQILKLHTSEALLRINQTEYSTKTKRRNKELKLLQDRFLLFLIFKL